MTDLDRIKEFFTMDRYAVHSGMEIESAEPERALCGMDICDRHLNAGNTVMGGAIFTLADFAFAVAANGEFACGRGPVTVSLTSNISFLAPPVGSRLTAEAKLISGQKRIKVYEVRVTDDTGLLVAVYNGTGYCKLS